VRAWLVAALLIWEVSFLLAYPLGQRWQAQHLFSIESHECTVGAPDPDCLEQAKIHSEILEWSLQSYYSREWRMLMFMVVAIPWGAWLTVNRLHSRGKPQLG
jgi:hypothetical protein